ncbi:hypothetical protein B0H11DRAFT_1916532 [Mycena galericulata]|nr:hypothetical protein B0H11DRAFT_1916532 [Mycena galericulata]
MLLDLGVVLACLALWPSWDNFCRAFALWTGQQKQHLIGHSRLQQPSGYQSFRTSENEFTRTAEKVVCPSPAYAIYFQVDYFADIGAYSKPVICRVWELFLSNTVSARKEWDARIETGECPAVADLLDAQVIRAVPTRALPGSASAVSTTTTTRRSTVPPGLHPRSATSSRMRKPSWSSDALDASTASTPAVRTICAPRLPPAGTSAAGIGEWASNVYSVENAGKYLPYALKPIRRGVSLVLQDFGATKVAVFRVVVLRVLGTAVQHLTSPSRRHLLVR